MGPCCFKIHSSTRKLPTDRKKRKAYDENSGEEWSNPICNSTNFWDVMLALMPALSWKINIYWPMQLLVSAISSGSHPFQHDFAVNTLSGFKKLQGINSTADQIVNIAFFKFWYESRESIITAITTPIFFCCSFLTAKQFFVTRKDKFTKCCIYAGQVMSISKAVVIWWSINSGRNHLLSFLHL